MNMPTRPGWWWIEADPEVSLGGLPYEAVYVRRNTRSGDLLISGRMPGRVDQRPDIVWLAEVPTPDVCRAVADYADAYLAKLADARAGGSYSNGEVRTFRLAQDALHDALRAARKGQEVSE